MPFSTIETRGFALSSRPVIAVDLGGTRIRAAVIEPDGTRIAFWRQSPTGPFPHLARALVVMRANGSEQRTLVADDVLPMMPIWSPGGQTIAFAHQTSEGSSVQIVEVTGRRISSLTAGAARDVPTSWH